MVVVAQLVRASDCDSEGRGFEPPRLPKFKASTVMWRLIFTTHIILRKHLLPCDGQPNKHKLFCVNFTKC